MEKELAIGNFQGQTVDYRKFLKNLLNINFAGKKLAIRIFQRKTIKLDFRRFSWKIS